MLSRMRMHNIKPNEIVYEGVIKSCCVGGESKKVRHFFTSKKKEGWRGGGERVKRDRERANLINPYFSSFFPSFFSSSFPLLYLKNICILDFVFSLSSLLCFSFSFSFSPPEMSFSFFLLSCSSLPPGPCADVPHAGSPPAAEHSVL